MKFLRGNFVNQLLKTTILQMKYAQMRGREGR